MVEIISFPNDLSQSNIFLKWLYIVLTEGANKDSSVTLNKVWVTLYTCMAIRRIILDLAPGLDSYLFIPSFRKFTSRRGCPSNVILDSRKRFASVETVEFVSNMGVDWKGNLLLAPGRYSEQLVRSKKELLRKQLHNYKTFKLITKNCKPYYVK